MQATWLSIGILVLAHSLPGADFNPVFRDHMVVQRDARVRVYGTGADGERVTLRFRGQAVEAEAVDGRWQAFLEPMPVAVEGSPMILSCNGAETRLNDVLVGDVWVLGGQSNMYRGMWAYPPLAETMVTMNQPLIRVFFVEPKRLKDAARRKRDFTIRGIGWTPVVYLGADGETQRFLSGISPTGYFFAVNLVKDKQVPVGLISACLGGTSAQAWTPREVFAANPLLKHYLDDPAASTLYNGVVYPITGFTVKGILWYQGESNAKAAEEYRVLFPEMIEAWRKDFGQGDLPFIYAQLASYHRVGWDKLGWSWAVLRESQAKALALPNTGMATLIDAGEYMDIHPAAKQVAGYRLYMKARQVAYGEELVASGPVYLTARTEGKAIRVTFGNTGGGLCIREVAMPENNTSKGPRKGGPITYLRSPADRLVGFTICGPDRTFVPAEATIVAEDAVLVRADGIDAPLAVRYAFANFTLANLYNQEGFPAEPFRTDSFQIPPREAFWPALKSRR